MGVKIHLEQELEHISDGPEKTQQANQYLIYHLND